MSKHAKQLKRQQHVEQMRLAERWGDIDIDRERCNPGEAWLWWDYWVRHVHAGPTVKIVEVSVELPLHEEGKPWLYVDGDPLIESEPLSEERWAAADAAYDATRHVALLQQYRAAIVADEAAGLAALRTAAGL